MEPQLFVQTLVVSLDGGFLDRPVYPFDRPLHPGLIWVGLTMIDTFLRDVPVLYPRFSYRGEDVVATLDRVCCEIGYPKAIRVDQGSEFISKNMDLWAYVHKVTLDFSRLGKPTENAFIDAFKSKFR